MTLSPSDVELRTFVVASTGDARFCLDVARVREVVPVGRVTPVPGAELSIRGVVNVRGRVLALADLAVALGGERSTDLDGTSSGCEMAIVLDLDRGREMAVAVHAVVDVIELPTEALQSPPSFGLGGAAPFAEGIVATPEGLAIVLDVEALFGETRDTGSPSMATGDGS